MSRFAFRLVLATFQMLLATSAWGQGTCNVTPETKRLIETILCSQSSQDVVYRQYGAGCFERSATKRLQDSAVQILMYEKCGESSFSDELRKTNLRAMKFMEKLSPCISEKVNLDEIMRKSLDFVRARTSATTCSSGIKRKLQSRRSFFESMIRRSYEINENDLFQKIGVRVDNKGNVFNR